MKKLYYLLLFCFLESFSHTIVAQSIDFPQWKEKGEIANLSSPFVGMPAEGMLHEVYVDIVPEDAAEPTVYETTHRIIRLRDESVIDRHNKGYISVYNKEALQEIKVRVIHSDGTVINVPEESFRFIENFENHGPFFIYAVDGLSPGSEIETFYTLKMPEYYFGRHFFQYDYPVQESRIVIRSPKNYKFVAKGYNGFDSFRSTEKDGFLYIAGQTHNIMPLDEERYALYSHSRVRVDHRLASVINGDEENPAFSWIELAGIKRMHLLDNYTSVKEDVKKLIKTQKWNKLKTTAQKIIAAEEFVKSQLRLLDSNEPELSDVKTVLKTKTANRDGAIKLLIYALEQMAIKYSVVFTSPKSNPLPDPDFPFWQAISDAVLYFPTEKKFLDPLDIIFRFGLISDAYIGSYGLFVPDYDPVSLQATAPVIKLLDPTYFPVSENNLDAEVVLNLEEGTASITHRQEYTAYRAQQLRPIYSFVGEEEKAELNKQIFTGMINGAEVKNVQVENTGLTADVQMKPFRISADLSSNGLLEQAGENFIFSLGQVIGPQVEMYQEKDRQCDIAMAHPVRYNRHITVHIPDGYSVKTIDGAVLDKKVKIGDDIAMQFLSGYNQQEDRIVFDLLEEYRNTNLSRMRIEEFRSVINASADYNKAVIIFQKK